MIKNETIRVIAVAIIKKDNKILDNDGINIWVDMDNTPRIYPNGAIDLLK